MFSVVKRTKRDDSKVGKTAYVRASSDKTKHKKEDDVVLSEEELAQQAVENADSEEEQKVYKKRLWQHKLKLGRHYTMERFTIMFGSLLSLLLLLFVASWGKQTVAQNAQIGTQAKYTESIEFSLSGTQGTITNIFRDPEGKRAFVMIDVPDVSNLSLDASNYEMFLTGFNKTLEQEPAASVIIFGSSGEMALEFYDERGLSNEVYGITLRNNSAVSNIDELSEEDLAELEDASFGRFDQTEIYVNVGAEDVTTLDVLEQDLDPVQLYYALVGRYAEDEVFDKIDATTKELGQLLAEHNEYANRISEYGFEAPAMPSYMDGDFIDENGNFRARTLVQGAHEIEYIGKRSTDGFITQVVDEPGALRQYMADKRAESSLAESSAGGSEPESTPVLNELVRKDGYILPVNEISTTDSTSGELGARDAVSSLNTVWSSYLTSKRQLQIELMRDLLVLDADTRTQGNAYSTHSGEDFLTIY